MAERRMLSKAITDHDNFTSLSASAQALYMHLCLSADDDGFCNQVSLAMFKAHAGAQDLEALIDRRYILRFESGVLLVKHFRMMNTLRKDRYKPTAYQEELAQLSLKENGSYTLSTNGCQAVAKRLPSGCLSIDKYSLNKSSSYIGSDDLMEMLTSDELSNLYKLYMDAGRLIDEVQSDIRKKKKKVEKPFEYIVGYATNKGWCEK